MYNEYEASEVIEVGKAEEMILGEKVRVIADEPGEVPEHLRPFEFALYDE